LTSLKVKGGSETHIQTDRTTERNVKVHQVPVPAIIAHKPDSASISMLDQEEEISACDGSRLAVGDLSVNSKVAMSVSSSVATPDIVEKHSLYARKVITRCRGQCPES
jgi:hypothetical protein